MPGARESICSSTDGDMISSPLAINALSELKLRRFQRYSSQIERAVKKMISTLAAKTWPVKRKATGKKSRARKSGAPKVTTEAATWSAIDQPNSRALDPPSSRLNRSRLSNKIVAAAQRDNEKNP